jgi:hypothetical protein
MSWTKKEWETHVLANCHSSYGLAAVLAGLVAGESPKELVHENVCNNVSGLSGFQGAAAESIGDQIRGADWLDQDMVEIMGKA